MTRRARRKSISPRGQHYRQLRHPFAPQNYFSEDHIQTIHDHALSLLETKGIKILLPEARDIFAKAGAQVDDDMVFIGRDIVSAAIASAPKSFVIKGGSIERDQTYELGAQIFGPAGGCPNANDAVRGRRAGDAVAFIETTKLQHHFDAIHLLGPSAEPQDIPTNERHYFMMETQLTHSDKPPSIYARGRAQTMDAFEILALARDVSDDEFQNDVWIKTVINTNSPRLIDVPMAQGIIDFARYGQMTIITPFCLAGAMAPITLSGALTLQHAESLAGIALAQLTRAGAPVSYGGFASNVNMKSGSPAFGTPEHVKLTIGTGQLARLIGFPFRVAAGSASNTADAQGAHENTMGLWAAAQAGATLTLHAAGWLEGGLSFGYEKFINDIEALNTFAELAQPSENGISDLAMASLDIVEPGGHFFDAPDTMERYETAFYEPVVADLDNFGAWQENGGQSSQARATKIWQTALDTYRAPAVCADVSDRISGFISQRKAAGGAEILS